MNKGMVWVYCFILFLSPSWAEEPRIISQQIHIYEDASARDFGKSWHRQGVKSISLQEFSSSRTLATKDPDGVVTAVVINARVVHALEKFLEGFEERWLEPAWYWKEKHPFRTIYTYYDPSLRLQFSFSFEKPNSAVLQLIDRTYARDPKNRKEVRDYYEKNFVVRIHAAENIFEPWLDTLTFNEILLAATLVGDPFQPLWGIHDGFGLLSNLPERVEAKLSLSLVEFRPLSSHQDLYYSFILRVHRMAGSFPKNLYQETNRRIETRGGLSFVLPEELLERGKGSTDEKVLLCYDVLLRRGYEAKLLAIRRSLSSDPFLMVVYRTGGRGNWGALWAENCIDHIAAKWNDVPSIVIGGEGFFILLEASSIFSTKRLEFPEGLNWSTF
ncbi:MAG: hypothetical protein SNJ78_01730 [Spirochaetales bacterium]